MPARVIEHDKLVDLHSKGLTPREIAERLGVNKDTVLERLCKINGPMRKKRPKQEVDPVIKPALLPDHRKVIFEIEGQPVSVPRLGMDEYWRRWAEG